MVFEINLGLRGGGGVFKLIQLVRLALSLLGLQVLQGQYPHTERKPLRVNSYLQDFHFLSFKWSP